jgi:cobalt-zinc-cadmium resistance protein CzcA
VQVLREKRSLLQQADTIYKNFLEKTANRFTAGEADILEKTTAENQRLQIAHQLQLLQADMAMSENRFRWLIQADSTAIPAIAPIIYPLKTLPHTNEVDNTQQIALQKEQLHLSANLQKLEKTRLLPTVSVGFNNTSIIGWQKVNATDEKYFDASKRFSSVSAGLEIPIFQKAQRSRIKAAGILYSQKQLELEAARKYLQVELANALEIFQHYRQQLATFDTKALPNAATMIATATRRLQAGEIAYLDWVMLTNQALSVRAEYFNLVQLHNEAAIRIEKLSATNN